MNYMSDDQGDFDKKQLKPIPMGEHLSGALLEDLYELLSWAGLYEIKAPRFCVWLHNVVATELERRDAGDGNQPEDHELFDFAKWRSVELGLGLLVADAICTAAKHYGAGQIIERIKCTLNGVVLLRLEEADELLAYVQQSAPRPETFNQKEQ
jgi:hypothetical protein